MSCHINWLSFELRACFAVFGVLSFPLFPSICIFTSYPWVFSRLSAKRDLCDILSQLGITCQRCLASHRIFKCGKAITIIYWVTLLSVVQVPGYYLGNITLPDYTPCLVSNTTKIPIKQNILKFQRKVAIVDKCPRSFSSLLYYFLI